MSAPKLPRLQPPQIPNSMLKGLERQEPPKSNFFLICMMTLMIMWSCSLLRKQGADSIPQYVEPIAATSPAPVLTDAEREALPESFREEAKREETEIAPKFVTLGSLDEKGEYRMLATLSNRGASLVRVELNESAYSDNSDSTGYLGQIVADEYLARLETFAQLPGVKAQVVGDSSPAQRAGLKPGDRIVGFVDANGNETPVETFDDLRGALLATKPGDKIKLKIYEAARIEESELFRSNALVVRASLMNMTRPAVAETPATVAPAESTESSAAAEGLKEAAAIVTGETAGSETAENSAQDAAHKVAADAESAEKTEEPASETTETAEADPAGSVADALAKLGAPTVLEVELSHAPLSVIRPSGMMLDYADYVDLAGLQGADYRADVDDLVLMNYDPKEEHVRKSNNDPCSFLTTFAQIDSDSLERWSPAVSADKNAGRSNAPRSRETDSELGGVSLRNGYWDYDENESNERVAVFKKILLDRKLEVVKKYELVRSDEGERAGVDSFVKNDRAYHLKLSVDVRNFDPNASRRISYLLDGPTGLPLEGAWFSSGRKTGPGFGSYGMRDVVFSTGNRKNFDVIKCWDISQDKVGATDVQNVDFLGVDGQYFQSTVILPKENSDFAFAPLRAGVRYSKFLSYTDVSFRMKSADIQLAPYGTPGDTVQHDFVVFVGPKQRDVMSDYGLSKTIVYGWFWFVSIPLLWILHFFHDYLVFNYGIAIILMTILVRLCLYPLSRKQVASSLKMQKLQPELAKLKEKYKDDPQAAGMAQMALFKKHGVNPMSGCLPIFIQMPIFIGLYKALSLDVNLYGAPLFSRSVRWCSNLAAPDMAFSWSNFWDSIGWSGFNMSAPGFLSMFALGPYLNILPVITIILFLVQQKLLVPPVVGNDEQAQQQRMMRKMMTFMMVFMGFMFFKVPSGLCVYFITSSVWGLLERKLLPKKDVELAAVVPDGPTVDSGTSFGMAGFETRKDRRRSYAKTGRSFEVYDAPRDRKGGRQTAQDDKQKKSGLRLWWEEVLRRAQEQQRLAKAEQENSSVFSRNRNGKNKKRR